jgi:hypothetical protein
MLSNCFPFLTGSSEPGGCSVVPHFEYEICIAPQEIFTQNFRIEFYYDLNNDPHKSTLQWPTCRWYVRIEYANMPSGCQPLLTCSRKTAGGGVMPHWEFDICTNTKIEASH